VRLLLRRRTDAVGISGYVVFASLVFSAKNKKKTYTRENGIHWAQRISIALHRTMMEAVWFWALDIQDAASRRRGGPMSLTAIVLRFGGGLGLGDEG
jgi:hypothetical protein